MKTIYLTYDGILDPLGQSQILPYLRHTRSYVSLLHILSFEKYKKTDEIYLKQANELKDLKINWTSSKFTPSRNIIFKFNDFIKFNFIFIYLCLKERPDIVHARGHPIALFALIYKRIFRFKLLFDYRGIWADERVAKGSWDLSKKNDLFFYNLFVRLEKVLINQSDHIIILTKAVKKKIIAETQKDDSCFTVIPCATDFSLFNIRKPRFKKDDQELVLGFLGSVGPAYQFTFYLKILSECNKRRINFRGLVLTNNLDETEDQICKLGDKNISERIKVVQTDRLNVPQYINQMSFLLSFYTPFKSIIGTSPVKISEALACGVPVIANSGIGDINEILKELNAGFILSSYSSDGIAEAVNHLEKRHTYNSSLIRESARLIYDLKYANKNYKKAYSLIEDLINSSSES